MTSGTQRRTVKNHWTINALHNQCEFLFPDLCVLWGKRSLNLKQRELFVFEDLAHPKKGGTCFRPTVHGGLRLPRLNSLTNAPLFIYLAKVEPILLLADRGRKTQAFPGFFREEDVGKWKGFVDRLLVFHQSAEISS